MDNQLQPIQSATPPQADSTQKKPSLLRSKDFWLGVGASVALNAVLLGAALLFPRSSTAIGGGAIGANLLLLTLLMRREKAAMGMLAAIGFLLVLTFCVAPLVLSAICFSNPSLQ